MDKLVRDSADCGVGARPLRGPGERAMHPSNETKAYRPGGGYPLSLATLGRLVSFALAPAFNVVGVVIALYLFCT